MNANGTPSPLEPVAHGRLSRTMHEEFPLPLHWRAALPSDGHVWEAPLVETDQVVARCGQELVALDPALGTVRWRAELHARISDATFLKSFGDGYVTDVIRYPEAWPSVVGVRRDGALAFRVDLKSHVLYGGTLVHDSELFVLGREPGVGQLLYRLSPEGELRGLHQLRWPATALVPFGDGLLAANPSDRRAPGLFTLARDGSHPQPVSDEPASRLALAGDSLLTLSCVTTEGRTGPRIIRVYNSDTLSVRWSAATFSPNAVLDGDAVLAVSDADVTSPPMLVARDTATGAERWRSPQLSRKITHLAAVGPVVIGSNLWETTFYHRRDGRWLGSTTTSFGAPAFAAGRLYVGKAQFVLCADAPDD